MALKKVDDQLFLEVLGARVHNLKNIDVKIPRNKLVVITGLSGSGKSSLAFNTIYAEGQRRYIETFSAYARQFIGNMERPDVDRITGLSPVIAIEQKTTGKNPRSTVGTITEIYDYLRLLYARVGEAYSHLSGEKMIKYTENQILDIVFEKYEGVFCLVLSPLVKGRKGHYRELFEKIRKQGFLKVRVDGEILNLTSGMKVDRYKVHDIEVVIDKVKIIEKNRKRLNETIKTALKYGNGSVLIYNEKNKNPSIYSKNLVDPISGISYENPEPNTFSFNTPYGACPKCNGLGVVSEVDMKKIIPNDELSIREGGFAPIGKYKENWIFYQMKAIAKKYNFTLDTKVKDISDEAMHTILYGANEQFDVKNEYLGVTSTYKLNFDGIINFINEQKESRSSQNIKKWVDSFSNIVVCPTCGGARLKKEALSYRLAEKNIAEVSKLDLSNFKNWIADLPNHLSESQNYIAQEIIREILSRTVFLLNVGLDYLSLNHSSKSLSGGELQRIRLATQIGSQLVGVLYILDEPSIGLHQRDNNRLIKSLQDLRDIGNTVLVVEHDKDMIMAADYVIDMGPGAGRLGGEVVAQGTPKEMEKCDSLTCQYISGDREIKIPTQRRKLGKERLIIKGATGNNLKNVTLKLPLKGLICITGVSGSGKSTLINETLYPIVNQYVYHSDKKPLPYESVEGLQYIDKIIEVDQSPIGKTPRSNPVTYTGVFNHIRKLFAEIPESKIRGYKVGRFSFNVKGGRCEACKGAGLRVIEMNFLPDVQVLCETCNGKRYNRETLEVRYRGKNINDVLNMTINEGVDFFENIPFIKRKLKTIQDVGLGYITLGQQSTTLSGGEAQRVKLSTELLKKGTGNTLYILDEPTTGLHFEDIKVLMNVIQSIVDKGNTVVIIEHNMDVIKLADYIIDIGPEGGAKGGEIVAEGTPEQIAKLKNNYTGHYLREVL